MREIDVFLEQIGEEQKNACEQFNKGTFNDILYAYVAISLHDAEVGRKNAEKVMNCLASNLDYYSAARAMLRHRKLQRGEEA